MTIRIPTDTTLTSECNPPTTTRDAIETRATLCNGRYCFTHDGKRYRVAETDATVIARDED